MLDRRHLLRTGIAAGSSLFLPWPASAPAPRRRRFDDPPSSPRLTPFRAPLPLPPAAQPVPPFTPIGASLPPQSTNPPTFHHLIAEARLVSLHPDLPPTLVWSYRDANVANSPFGVGPTLIGRAGHPLIVRHSNVLPPDHVGFGDPHTTVHFHGGHVEARSDGFPENLPGFRPVFGPGESYDYAYALLDPGFSQNAADPTDRPATMWYHDHAIDFTAQNVYRGLAGFFLFFDELDTGDETTGLRLPSGDFDVPMVLQDRRVDRFGQLVYDPFQNNGFLGDVWMVNSAIQPFLNVRGRKYRFRLLNGSNARFLGMQLAHENGALESFDMIATEGGLMATPLHGRNLVFLSPAQREDIVIDFSRFPEGTVLYLENRLAQDDGRGPRGTFLQPELRSRGDRFLKIIVGAPVPDPSQVPAVLRPFSAIPAATIAAALRQSFEFQRSNGAWLINGQPVDLARPMAVVQRGQPEVWTLRNGGGGWWHPIHIHLEFMHVLQRNGRTPPIDERDGQAKRDVITLGPGDEVKVFFDFRDFPGRWVFHCHNLEHEDVFMMARFDVV